MFPSQFLSDLNLQLPEVSPCVVDEKILNDGVIFDAMIYDSGK